MPLPVPPTAALAVLGRAADAPATVSPLTVAVVVAALLLVVGGGLLRVVGRARARRATEERGTWVDGPGVDRSGPGPPDRRADDALLADARALFVAVQEAWDARDDRRMRALLGPELLADWRGHRDDFEAMGWRSRISVLGAPRVRIVGGRALRDGEERVTVAVACAISSWISTDDGELLPRGGGTVDDEDLQLRQHWTLGRRGGRWYVVAIDEATGTADEPR